MKPPRAALPLFVAALTLTALAPSARAQSVADALRNETKPVALADLPVGYRAVSIGTGGESLLSLFGFGMGAAFGGGSSSKPEERLLVQGLSATWVDPDEFAALLEGKTPRIRGYRVDLGAMIAADPDTKVAPLPVFTETWIEGGRIAQWSPLPGLTKANLVRAFSNRTPNSENQGQAVETAMAPAQVGHLEAAKMVATALLMYSGDSDDRLPRADSTDQAKTAAMPYLKEEASWPDPFSDGRRLLFNTALSGRSLASVPSPKTTLLLWEDRPGPDGRYAVAFADGSARLVAPSEWQQLQETERRRRVGDRKDAASGSAKRKGRG